MTKAELITYVAKETKASQKTVDAVLKSVVDAIHQTLKKGGEIRIGSLGTFKVLQRKARTGINPQTKAKMKIPAKKAPAFRAAKALKDAVGGAAKKPAKKK
jgi:DNA-binding protein HU-beta